MKNKLIVGLLISASASLASSAFASGYGPAPFYRPSNGAPASQRGQSAQTIATEQHDSDAQSSRAYGGVSDNSTQAGSRLTAPQTRGLFAEH
jgi:hypothetical protein